MEEKIIENKSEDISEKAWIGGESENSVDRCEAQRESTAKMSGEHQNRFDSTQSADNDNCLSEQKQASKESLDNCEDYSIRDPKKEDYSEYYNSYYANYYQHCKVKNDCSETDSDLKKNADINSKPRPMDLINKALAKQHMKSREDNTRDEDEEEGQIPSSPRIVSKGSYPPSNASSSPVNSSIRNSAYNSSKSMSRSRSPSKHRLMKSRSRSRSHKRYISRSRSRSPSRRRRRTRSRSRSPYFGPIIKDYRRGRRGFVRYPRGFRDRGIRPFRRGHHSHYNSYGFSRRNEFSRSRSRSISPKRRHTEIDKSGNNSEEEKTIDSKQSETLKPSDIKLSEKRLTQSFLAMLEEKQNRTKMIPMDTNRSGEASEGDDHFNRQHGFVNTFNSVREMDSRKHTLSYDLEREGWQVIDDANSESRHRRRDKSKDDHKYEDKYKHLESKESVGQEKTALKEMEVESSSNDENENKKKKKKSKKRKKRKKRKVSTSSDSSDSESENENEEELETNDKKRSKKKRKKKKKVVSSSSSSEDEERAEKVKKKKRKKKEVSSHSESEDKAEDDTSLVSNSKIVIETTELIEKSSSVVSEETKEGIKTKDKKKKKRKTKVSESSDSDSDLDNKKKKKKNKKKKSKKRRHRSSSSSSSSDSSDSSESGERKKKKKRKSKKKKTKKHKKDKKSEKKEKSKATENKKRPKEEDSEFLTVLSVGEPSLELKWPKKLIKYTECEPRIQYSVNPKVQINSEDFRPKYKTIEEIEKNRKLLSHFESDYENESICPKDSEKLVTEYERFIDELNPNSENDCVSEESRALELKMRDKLVKHMFDKNEFQNSGSVTPSEKRAIEKLKKQSLHSYDGSVDNRKHEDVKSAPLSAYYSAKVQKSSPIHSSHSSHRSDDLEKHESKSSKICETENSNKSNENSLSIGSHKSDSQNTQNVENFKIDDKKRTARELIERVKQRKHSNESHNRDRDESHNSKRMPQIGKIKIPAKKSFSKTKTSITTANADSTQNTFVSQPMKLDMNYDYNWYYRYYMNSVFGVGQYPQVNNPALASAYYAQYSMLTSYDYNQTDLTNWMTQRGYALDTTSVMTENEMNVKPNETEIEKCVKTEEFQSCVESSASDPSLDPNKVENITECSEENVDKVVNTEDSVKDESTNHKNIEVLVSTSHSEQPFNELNANEVKTETDSSNMSPFSSAKFKHKVKVRVTANSHNDVESIDSNSPPPPPPPPARPQMTTLTALEPVTLPNGQVLPAGTKQTVVHPYPYPTNDSYRHTSDWYYNAFNTQNALKSD